MTRPAAQAITADIKDVTGIMELIKDAEEEEDQAQGEIVGRAPRGLQDLPTAATAGMWVIFSGASETSTENYSEQELRPLVPERRSGRRLSGRRQAWARAGPTEASMIKEPVVIKETVEVEAVAALQEGILAAEPPESLATAVEARAKMESSTTIESSTTRSPRPSSSATPAAAMPTGRSGAVP